MTAENEYDFFDYKSMSNIINCEVKHAVVSENSDTVECTFNQIHPEKGDINVTYFLKVVENSTYIYGEEMNTIAVTESPNSVFYKRNPAPGVGYINIIAQVQQNNIIEYVAYNGIMDLKPDPNKKEGGDTEEEQKDNTLLFAIVGGVLGVIVIALVIVIIVFQIKNKNLMNQVKHVSFQKTNANVDPNLLLQKPSDSIN